MKILQNPIISSVLGLVLYIVVTIVVWKAPASVVEGEMSQEEIVAKAKTAVPSWEFSNPEADTLIQELKTEKESLAKREKELNDLAERLKAERMEINVVTQAVYELQARIDANIVRINIEESANIKKLARTYAAMTPDGAVPIMKEMDESTFTKILAVMKEAESAPILEAMAKLGPEDTKRVAKVTERLRFFLSQPKDGKKANP